MVNIRRKTVEVSEGLSSVETMHRMLSLILLYVSFQKDLVVWKPIRAHNVTADWSIVSEGLSSVET